ncbi:MAG: SprT-like domain-containing protein [Bacteroidales bacterium]|nr:SprT-like domain-containing protein [Bacteroidales bacterium]
MKPEEKAILKRFLPANCLDMVSESIKKENISLRITASRSTRLGDFRPPKQSGNPFRISLNHDLNPYQFLITFVHELAHLKVFQQYKSKVKAHGQEWKQWFQFLMRPYLESDVFPSDLQDELVRYLSNPKASSGYDLSLTRCLQHYDAKQRANPTVEEIAVGTVFKIPNGRTFRKGERLRKRFKCQCLHSKRWYLFNPITEVLPVDQ